MNVLNYSRLSLTVGLAALSLNVVSCTKTNTDSPAPTELASFDLIQQKILTPSCATSGCHLSEKDATFFQHGLVLAEGVAYQNLVGVDPKNSDAKTDGLKRVKAFASLESLLYHKLNISASHHTGKQYGNPMPLGGTLLPDGQIEFVRRWIEAGAPKTGSVVTETTLLDNKTVTNSTFESLPVPAAGTGFQMAIPSFDIQPSFERELFTRRMVGNTQDVYVNRYETKMRSGSHHFVAYDFRNKSSLPNLNDIRDLRNADNSLNITTALTMSNHVYLAGSQAQYQDYVFPEGAALLIPAGASFDLNSHFVNKTSTVMKGEAQINLYTVDKSTVQHVVQTLDLSNTNLTIPANGRVTLTKSFAFNKARKVLTLTSHMHKSGEKFVIKIMGGSRNGEVVYTSTDWEHPDIITFKTPIDLQKGEGLISEITYNNTTGKAISFGLTSEDEMGIIFGYYYEE
ncbi:monooxygenase [Spirosoma flavum]|uniref:Copper type II ascorbate-dependent monooxygenase C-terminal domain-containing protein n=1 Tax=Spirosoma flavum TaxID=2048557 RepID=A0ABW6AJJ6_9BACT